MPFSDFGMNLQGEALVCMKDQDGAEFVLHALKGMDYKVTTVFSQKEAMDKFKFNQYTIIIMENDFGSSLEENQVLQEVREMAPSHRRKTFVALLGDDWQTGEELPAFALSVNLTINKSSLGQFADIITHAMAQQEKFYKVYIDTMTAMGKG